MDMTNYIVTFIILHQTFGLRGPPRLTAPAQTIEVARVGHEVRISCPIESDPAPIFDWTKDGEDITPAWTPRLTFKKISKILRIRPISLEDSGVYRCKGINGFGSEIARIRLIIVENTPDPKDLKTLGGNPDPTGLPRLTSETLEQATNVIHILEGNSIQLTCAARGTPPPRVIWFKDGHLLSDKVEPTSKWKLTLTKVDPEDTGSYECVASNSMGRVNVSIRLEIGGLDSRRPELGSNSPSNVTTLLGSGAVLECIVESKLTAFPPHIKWLKRVSPGDLVGVRPTVHGQPRLFLPADNSHVIVIQDTGDRIRIVDTPTNGTIVSKLVITNVQPSDDGTYLCLATNSQGFTFNEANLTVLDGSAVAHFTDTVPLPLILILSILAMGTVIGGVQVIRKYHERTGKQRKEVSSRLQLTSAVTLTSQLRESWEHSQLLVLSTTSAPSTSCSSEEGHFHNHHHHHHRCSCSTTVAAAAAAAAAVTPNTFKLTQVVVPCHRTFGHWR